MKKWHNSIKKIEEIKQKRTNQKINKHRENKYKKMSNKAFGKNGKTRKKLTIEAPPPQTAWYWIRSKKFLTVG